MTTYNLKIADFQFKITSQISIECMGQSRFIEFLNNSDEFDIEVKHHLVENHTEERNNYELLSPFKVKTNFPSYSFIDCKPLGSEALDKTLLNCANYADQISIELRENSAVVTDFKKHRIDIFQTKENLHSIASGRVGPSPFSCFLHDFDSMMIHCSCVSYSGNAAIFLGMDDGGKTTAASLCGGGTVLADDQILFKKEIEGNWKAHGTPFTTFPANSGSASPKAFFLLEKADYFMLKKLTSRELFASLWNEHSRSRLIPSQSRTALLDLYLSLSSSAPVYLMKFPKDYIDQEAILKCLDH